ncbi:serine palmitoyltransferase small subunit A [Aplysia californica]|uniref:Serine palmitoyltransferase small subunit A n=1 Tax=Aplysia californica TaxID=6500 RepID=A0ABM0JI85_APLCA|nr:serine palmitoyltransferase small subunit A [Aplysia californica]
MVLQKAYDRFSYWYFSYTILSNVYFLEPVERWACNAMLVFFLALVLYTSYVYLPGHSVMMLHFFRYLFGMETESDVTVVD